MTKYSNRHQSTTPTVRTPNLAGWQRPR
jgi:hypothetical protein